MDDVLDQTHSSLYMLGFFNTKSINVALAVRHVQHWGFGSGAVPSVWDRDGAGPDPRGPERRENSRLLLPQMASSD